MFVSASHLLGIALLAATSAKAGSWGPAWSLGPTHGSAAVVEATTHFTPGKPPNPGNDILSLWIGISNSTSGLIQSGTDSVKDPKAYCGARNDQWCGGASYFGCNADGGCYQDQPAWTPIEATDVLTINYKLQTDQKTWVQTVTVNGTVISTMQSYDGPLYQGGFGTGTECNESCTGSVSTQYYKNTTVVLSQADAQFGSTLGVGTAVVASTLYTSDSGKTWKVDSIAIPAMIKSKRGGWRLDEQ